MILVAFVLVLVATVMLIIGTFFNAGVAYIWISIAACVATFVVLGISYAARRRNADAPATRPEPLADGSSRSAATRSAPRTAADQPVTPAADDAPRGADARVTVVPHRPDTGDAARDETEVMVPVAVDATHEEPPVHEEPAATEPPAPVVEEEPVAAPEPPAVEEPRVEEPAVEEPAAEEPPVQEPAAEEQPAAAQQAPRRVAPRRVVRRAAPAAAGAAATDAAAEPAPAAASGTPRVVRRAAPAGDAAPPATGGQQRVVRRVVRRPAGEAAAAATGPTAGEPADESTATPAAGTRSGTRGKRARAVLSEIKGVGPAKQDALLKRFGSLEEMASASIEDLSAVKGVGPSVAQQIKQILSDR